MAGRIPKDFIDQLMSRVDIVDIIHARVPLKKAGREYVACCPFHNEKTPSFTVSPTKQFYHCFGCGAHGTAVTFLMDYEHMDYAEAIEALAQHLSLVVPREYDANFMPSSIKKTQADDLYIVLAEVSQFYAQCLAQAAPALAYIEQRGLVDPVIQHYQLGFSPEHPQALAQRFEKSYSTESLIATGLRLKNESGQIYDRFRGRLMFPIRDRRGRVIGFGGRIIGEGKPKYLNSPETVLFHKGSQLYGLYEARQHTRQLERLIVVEGYMDVIALAQFGITYAVATLGTATTSEHIKQLFRLVPEVVFCFDGDRAGRSAAWKALETALSEVQDGREIRFLFLPTGEDPDTQVRKVGQAGFEESLHAALPLTKFFILGLKEILGFSPSASLHVVEDSAKFSAEAGRLLDTMPDSLVKRALLVEVQRLGRLGGGTVSATTETPKRFSKPWQAQEPVKPKGVLTRLPTDYAIRKTPVRYAIALLLHEPKLAKWIENPEKLIEWDIAGLDLLLKVVEVIEEHPHIHSAGLLELFRDSNYAKALSKIMSWQPADAAEAVLEREFQDCLRQIRRQARQKALEALLDKEQTQGLSLPEKHDLLSLLDELHTPSR